jgi:hypothetical protein
MREPAIPLISEPTREDYRAVVDAADLPCECGPEVALLLKEASAAEQVMCKPCGARQILNGMVTLAEVL